MKTDDKKRAIELARIAEARRRKTSVAQLKQFKVEGMHCGHCRMQVEKALNAIPGVNATVTLTPPAATVEFIGPEKSIHELQKWLSEAGDYRLIE